MSITSVFVNGGSQAVRMPKKYRFSTERVTVQPMKNGMLILPMARKPTLAEFFTKCDELDADERKFLSVCRRYAFRRRGRTACAVRFAICRYAITMLHAVGRGF